VEKMGKSCLLPLKSQKASTNCHKKPQRNTTKNLNETPQKASTNCHKKPQRTATKSLNETPQKASTIMVNSNIFNTFASNNKLNPYGVFIENGRWVA
jgi:hypothetical protein